MTEAVSIRRLSRRFGNTLALDDVTLAIAGGEVHALLGPNGAGKTTLLRTISGHHAPSSGSVHVMGISASGAPRALRTRVGLVPAGDRTFYLRISGLENLVFFARLHGLRRRDAVARAHELLERVGLEDAAHRRVGLYSHGMQKRLGIARALLVRPPVLLVDEATHDLDPMGARRVRELVADAASNGAAVVWATQRLDEIRGFADGVTVLAEGRVSFQGSVPELLAHSLPRRYVVRLQNGRPAGAPLGDVLQQALGTRAAAEAVGAEGSGHYLLALAEDVRLGEAIAALVEADVDVLSCRQEASDVEDAFLALVGARDE